ncbi:hypothetical protein PF001_g5793 [Phytophthora fragariae]|uniref:Uncharacterized protein n=1 Tax=Phytophthora fragariae TaxID=53985 RepID=A0A6A3UDP2_9STRA|nr:hypothetical protein PF006_g5940 [Phytophthora fragariae]KAE9319640.1 hypothetical protein PF001_g5793 [Phytophthora fragariae]
MSVTERRPRVGEAAASPSATGSSCEAADRAGPADAGSGRCALRDDPGEAVAGLFATVVESLESDGSAAGVSAGGSSTVDGVSRWSSSDEAGFAANGVMVTGML